MMHENREEQLVWLLQISRRMLATRDLEQLLTLITDAFLEATRADRAFLLLDDRREGQPRPRAGRAAGGGEATAEAPVRSVVTEAFRQQRPFLETRADAHRDAAARKCIEALSLEMLVAMPVVSENEALGVLYADSKTAGAEAPSATDRKTLELLAEHGAAAIENARMFERTTHDPLTGLPNHSYFMMQLNKAMGEAQESSACGILLLDLDDFKRINHVAGAEMGDRALVDVAQTLQETLRADGLVARYGSDKFAILLPCEPEAAITLRLRDVAERARAAVAAKNFHGIQLSASIGGVGHPGNTAIESAPDLIATAEDVLGKARAETAGEVRIG